jgi:hypothetical protein
MPQAPFTPAEIFARFERGEMDRDELHALLALHARELIEEMEEDYQNHAAALVEYLLAKRALKRLLRRHGPGTIREVLVALSKIPDFPPARLLWNAAHPDVPLHCFLRIRREPVFRIREIRPSDDHSFIVTCEFGAAGRGLATVRSITLTRDPNWNLTCAPTAPPRTDG